MTKTNAQNLSRRHVPAMHASKTITKKVVQQPAPAQLERTKGQLRLDSPVKSKGKFFPEPKQTYLSPHRERSYTPLQRKGSPQKQAYMMPVSDQFFPTGCCFQEPPMTMSQFKAKINADNVLEKLGRMSLTTAPQQPAQTDRIGQHITYTKITGVRAYHCSECGLQVGESSISSHRDRLHPGYQYTRPGLPGRRMEGDHYENGHAHTVAMKQGLKWHQQSIGGYNRMYHPHAPHVVMRRELNNGQELGISYRSFNADCGDTMLAGSQDPGIDFAMQAHQKRFGNCEVIFDRAEVEAYLAAETGQVVDLGSPRFKLDKLNPLYDGLDFGPHEKSLEHHVQNAQRELYGELESAILLHVADAQVPKSLEIVYPLDEIKVDSGYRTESIDLNNAGEDLDNDMI